LDREDGWSCGWAGAMDYMVDGVFTIESILKGYIVLSGWYFPYFVLEKVVAEVAPVLVDETAAKDAEVDSLLYEVTSQLWDFINDHTNYNTFKSDCEKGEIYCIEEMIPERVFKIKVTEVELIEKDSNDR
jgi:hypothetical protein